MKYDWIALEKEFILSDYKSISAFLKSKNIDNKNGSVKKATKGWKEKKAQKEHFKSTKIIEKVIEEESTKEAEQKVNINSIADKLALKILESVEELDRYLSKETQKIKTVTYDKETQKIQSEKVEEISKIKDCRSILDRRGISLLAGALKDLNDIRNNSKETNENEITNIENLMIKIKEVADDEHTD